MKTVHHPWIELVGHYEGSLFVKWDCNNIDACLIAWTVEINYCRSIGIMGFVTWAPGQDSLWSLHGRRDLNIGLWLDTTCLVRVVLEMLRLVRLAMSEVSRLRSRLPKVRVSSWVHPWRMMMYDLMSGRGRGRWAEFRWGLKMSLDLDSTAKKVGKCKIWCLVKIGIMVLGKNVVNLTSDCARWKCNSR